MDTSETVQHFLTHLTLGNVRDAVVAILMVYVCYLLGKLLAQSIVDRRRRR